MWAFRSIITKFKLPLKRPDESDYLVQTGHSRNLWLFGSFWLLWFKMQDAPELLALCDVGRLPTGEWTQQLKPPLQSREKQHKLWQTDRICTVTQRKCVLKNYSSRQELLHIAVKRKQHHLNVQHTVRAKVLKQWLQVVWLKIFYWFLF